MTVAEEILDLARWAPSGDNSQPWRFAIRSEREIDVFGYDTRAHCVYDLDGWASQVAHGMLLETIAIATSQHGRRASIDLPGAMDASPLVYRVTLDSDPGVAQDPLAEVVKTRTVQRRPMRLRALTAVERTLLEQAARPLRIAWFESWSAKRRIAALCARNARIRLTIPEAYAVHRSVIQWHATTSEDRMPDASLGADAFLLSLMRFGMTSWQRLDRLNRLTGTLVPRLALDYVPGMLCSAQLALIAELAPTSLADRIAAGRAVQRVWLTATSLGLQMQPEYTPLIFARYAREGRPFTKVARARVEAADIARDLSNAVGKDSAESVVWLSRIGPQRAEAGRSLRLPLARLVVVDPPPALPPLAVHPGNASA